MTARTGVRVAHPVQATARFRRVVPGTVARLGVRRPVGYLRVCSLAEGGCVTWMSRLVKIGVEGEAPCMDVMEINRPDDLRDIADLGLTLAEAKRGSVKNLGQLAAFVRHQPG